MANYGKLFCQPQQMSDAPSKDFWIQSLNSSLNLVPNSVLLIAQLAPLQPKMFT